MHAQAYHLYIWDPPPLSPSHLFCKKLNLKLAFIHSHLISVHTGKETAFSSGSILKTSLCKIAKRQIGGLVKCVISAGLGMRYTDGKSRRHLQSPIIWDNDGVLKLSEIMVVFGNTCKSSRFGHTVLIICLGQTGKLGSGRKQVQPNAFKYFYGLPLMV